MMKTRLLLTMLVTLLTVSAWAQSAKEIIEKSEEQMRGESSYIEMTIQTVRPSWTREMKMKSWAEGLDNSMVLVTAPAKEKGTVFLKRGKEVWNWIPRIDRIVKLPPSMMSQSWMGTDFTNDDLVKQSSILVDFEHKIVGDSVIENRNCWKLLLTPKEEAAVVWGKLMIWVDQQDYLQLRTEFYDEEDYLINVMQASDIRKLGGRMMPARLEMIPVEEEGHKTILIYNNVRFNEPVEARFFTTQNMKRMR